jgi:hypothetical protein
VSSNLCNRAISAVLFTFFCFISVSTLIGSKAVASYGLGRAESGGLTEGLLVEAQLKQGSSALAGRVLIEAGRSEWTTIASTLSSKSVKNKRLKLEARATLLDSDIVEVETRISGELEQTGKLIVRLGESATITTSQMEGSETSAATSPPATSVGVKVLRVRYSR